MQVGQGFSMTTTHNMSGPLGTLQAVFQASGDAPHTTLAILCHPHPLYGGNMDDSVLSCLERMLLKHGIDCLKFNFRGVGTSAGTSSEDNSETDDLLAVVAWAEREFEYPELWLGGYSFGANMVWRAAPGTAAKRLLLVAPPVGRMQFETRSTTGPVDVYASTDVYAGTADEFIDQTELLRWQDVRLHLLQGADHFFSYHRDELEAAIDASLR